jgi:hypothetical protein
MLLYFLLTTHLI